MNIELGRFTPTALEIYGVPRSGWDASSIRRGPLLVRIRYDGIVEYGPDYEPDEAARRFWEALKAAAPERFK